jgi:aminoglycoside phosphotransferase (APT) family kinase protein
MDLIEQLRASGQVRSEHPVLTPLTGGVSSDIQRVDDGGRVYAVKRALAKLKVAADWRADVRRNVYEQRFLADVARFRPDAVPALLHADEAQSYFCMEFLDGYTTWKDDLLAGRCDPRLAAAAGTLLGDIHRTTFGDAGLATRYDSAALFDALRIDPYLRASARQHPTLAAAVLGEAERLGRTRECLVHGDFSPKNIMHRDQRLVLLDCEVACHGDPAFDLAFLLNHLHLKALAVAPARGALRGMLAATRTAYRLAFRDRAAVVEARCATLLPMLLLARVDGKSPVEYLQRPAQQALVRAFASAHILTPPASLDQLEAAWFDTLERHA